MSTRTYIACHQAVSQQHTNPPSSFLDQVIDAINPLPDDVFGENSRHDIYAVMLGSLGPYTGLLHRKAVMCEVLRVEAAFESDWNWNEGVDITNHHSMTHIEGEETGAFQVSADSMVKDSSLKDCVRNALGSIDPITFINGMKRDHRLAVEYCARLLRFSTTWCGTINDAHKVIAHARRDAVAEFQTFLQVGVASASATAPATVAAIPPGVALPSLGASFAAAPQSSAAGDNAATVVDNGSTTDAGAIPKLLELASNAVTLGDAEKRAARKLLNYDGEIYPHDGCAITLSTLLQDAGIDIPDTYRAIDLGALLRDERHWQVIAVGNQQAGDIGSTCGETAHHKFDHIYVVLQNLNGDEMVIADNQSSQPHFRFASGQGGKTPTTFFLRAA